MLREKLNSSIALLLVIFAVGFTVLAIMILPNGAFSWTTLAQDNTYNVPTLVPPAPGVVQQGGNAIVDPGDDGSISIISFGPDGQTPDSLYISPEELANLPDNPTTNVKVTSTSDGYVNIYKLTTGEFQANLGPDAEGKIFVYIFQINPTTCVSHYQFTVSDPTHRFDGAC